jgi:ribosome-binding factor A
MAQTHRIEKVNHLIRQQVSELLQREVKDPRLECFVAVTDVKTSPDLSYAKIFVSTICNEDEKKKVLAALNAASGFIRNELVKRLRMRRIPELAFEWDESIARGARVLELLDKVASEQSPGG